MVDEVHNQDAEEVDGYEDWTPTRGLLGGFLTTLLVALVFAAVQGLLTYYAPRLTINGLLNAFGCFVLTWVLFAVMHRVSGQIGWIVTLLVVVLACLVIASKHIVLAQHGILTDRGELIAGWQWLHPMTIYTTNLIGWIGVAAGAALCRKGDSILLDVAKALTYNLHGG
ncbi:MAG: hypothetical protein ABII12_11940 [Planctomycetota bacterium]